jgi:hypothetical protein
MSRISSVISMRGVHRGRPRVCARIVFGCNSPMCASTCLIERSWPTTRPERIEPSSAFSMSSRHTHSSGCRSQIVGPTQRLTARWRDLLGDAHWFILNHCPGVSSFLAFNDVEELRRGRREELTAVQASKWRSEIRTNTCTTARA